MRNHKIRHYLHAIAVAAFAAILSPPSDARAAPVELFASSANGSNASLRGDLSGDILTLNSTAPRSHILLELSSASDTVAGDLSLARQAYPGPGYDIFVRPNLEVIRSLNDWLFDVGGSMNFAAGTVDVNLSTQPLWVFSASARPVFFGTVDPNLGPIAYAVAEAAMNANLALLHAVNLDIDVDILSNSSVAPGTASAALVQNGAIMQVDLALMDWQLLSETSVDVDVTLDVALPGFPPDFPLRLQNFITDQIFGFLEPTLSRMMTEFSSETGFQLECRLDTVTSRRADTVCDFSAELSYFGAGTVAAVPEPATSGLIGAGLAALLLARRRRRT